MKDAATFLGSLPTQQWHLFYEYLQTVTPSLHTSLLSLPLPTYSIFKTVEEGVLFKHICKHNRKQLFGP